MYIMYAMYTMYLLHIYIIIYTLPKNNIELHAIPEVS